MKTFLPISFSCGFGYFHVDSFILNCASHILFLPILTIFVILCWCNYFYNKWYFSQPPKNGHKKNILRRCSIGSIWKKLSQWTHLLHPTSNWMLICDVVMTRRRTKWVSLSCFRSQQLDLCHGMYSTKYFTFSGSSEQVPRNSTKSTLASGKVNFEIS